MNDKQSSVKNITSAYHHTYHARCGYYHGCGRLHDRFSNLQSTTGYAFIYSAGIYCDIRNNSSHHKLHSADSYDHSYNKSNKKREGINPSLLNIDMCSNNTGYNPNTDYTVKSDE